jgi:hypothetical protein
MKLDALFLRRAIGLAHHSTVFPAQNAEQIRNDVLELPAGLKSWP